MSAVKILDSHTGLLLPEGLGATNAWPRGGREVVPVRGILPHATPPLPHNPPPPHPTAYHFLIHFRGGGGGAEGDTTGSPQGGWWSGRVNRWVVVSGGVVEGRRRRGGGWGISDFGNIRKGTGPPGNRGGGREHGNLTWIYHCMYECARTMNVLWPGLLLLYISFVCS
jgi:hypothetical protein